MFETNQMNDILKPPKGFKATDALFLTYSLNMKVLDSILTDCKLFGNYRNEAGEAAEHVVCFFQNNRFISEKNDNDNEDSLFGRLLNKKGRIIGIEQQNGSSFHPKLFLLLFKDTNNNDQILRLVIGSRNISRTNYFEGIVCIEGKPKSGNERDKNKDLVEFISKLAEENQTVKTFTALLGRTDFSECIQSITADDAKYSFVKYPGDNGSESFENSTKLRIISPFLGNCGFIEGKIKNCKDWKIITREKVSEKSLPKDQNGEPDKSNFRCLRSEKQKNKDSETPTNELHAKVYAFTKDGIHHLYIGSANFSDNGFGKNDELMLHIWSQKCDFVGEIDKALNDKNLSKDLTFEDTSDDSLPEGETLPEETASDDELIAQLNERLERFEAAVFFTEILGKSVDPETYAEDFVREAGKAPDKKEIKNKAEKYETNSELIKRYKDEITGGDSNESGT